MAEAVQHYVLTESGKQRLETLRCMKSAEVSWNVQMLQYMALMDHQSNTADQGPEQVIRHQAGCTREQLREYAFQTLRPKTGGFKNALQRIHDKTDKFIENMVLMGVITVMPLPRVNGSEP